MKVYVSNYLSRSISILDYSTLEFERDIKLDENIYPHNFCIDNRQQLAYIPSSLDGELYVLDLSIGKIIDNISIGGKLTNIALCNDELFISNEDSNSIYILDVKTSNPIGVIGVDNMPHGFDIDSIEFVILLFSILAVIGLNGCQLDREPETVLTDTNFWKSETDFRGACNRLYIDLPGFGHDYRSDEIIGTSQNGISSGNRTVPGTSSDWTDPYNRIGVANNIIKKVSASSLSEAIKNRWLAEEIGRAHV